MYWAEEGAPGGVRPIRTRRAGVCASTKHRFPTPRGTAITLSPFRRPTNETAPVDAKAGCLYPNNARALIEAQRPRLR